MSAPDYQLIRAELLETKDDGETQRVIAQGRDSERLGGQTGVLRIQMFGESSHAPAGAHGIVLVIGGNMDQAVLLGLEHPDHRPQNLGAGDKVIYDAHGQKMHFKNGEAVMTVTKLVINCTGQVIINSSDINLGGTGGKPVAVQGTVDSAGHTLVSNFATKVKAV